MPQDVGDPFPGDGGQQEGGGSQLCLGRGASTVDPGSETSDEMPEMLPVSCAWMADLERDSDMKFQVPSEEVLRSMELQTTKELCIRKPEVSSEVFTECLLYFFWLVNEEISLHAAR